MITLFTHTRLSLGCFVLLLGFTGCQEKNQELNENDITKKPITEKPILQMINAPEGSFITAKEDYSRNDYQKSADAIREVIPYLQNLSIVSTEKGQNVIDQTIGSLNALSKEVASGKIKSEKLDKYLGFVDANIAHSEIMASENLLQSDHPEQAGITLDNMLKHTAEAASRLTGKSKFDDQPITQHADILKKAIIQHKAMSQEEAHQKFSELKNDLMSLQSELKRM